MEIPGKKILIPVEVQAQAQQVIVEMKKMIDEMDAKVSRFQSMGFTAWFNAAILDDSHIVTLLATKA